jgi:hypothetical protein
VWQLHTYDGQNITSSLIIVWVNTLNSGVISVLALVGVLEETEEHVDKIDKYIGAEHALPEVLGVVHLGQEVEE